ncbi:ORF2 protein [Cacao swollen shoot Ghana J virus]|uniref:ORF2 protein n=1 Tax=Cacao swollen shoot Ghana J virus TaxID=2056880 RepID=UPI000CA3E69F|nr:ORF2 protein [Cacao swollen shoot Ghana J virus]ATZ69466.1 ORF2 protein [Cacao swollen shoot Ghana J virus]
MTDSSSYQRAIQAAERVDPPAVGITTTTGITAVNGVRTIVKQNNVQILLLAEIAEKLEDLLAIQKQSKKQESSGTIPEDLIEKLQKLTIQDAGSSQKTTRGREGQGTLYGFRDPYRILAEEKAKLSPIPKKKDESKGKATASDA